MQPLARPPDSDMAALIELKEKFLFKYFDFGVPLFGKLLFSGGLFVNNFFWGVGGGGGLPVVWWLTLCCDGRWASNYYIVFPKREGGGGSSEILETLCLSLTLLIHSIA